MKYQFCPRLQRRRSILAATIARIAFVRLVFIFHRFSIVERHDRRDLLFLSYATESMIVRIN